VNEFGTDAQALDTLRREAVRTEYPADLPEIPPLPVGRYTDPAFYELELEHVFGKSWLTAGHVSQIPAPGSYLLFEELNQSIIVVRGTDDVIRAFKNACKHRGAALVTEPSGVARRFVCPYHAWTYSTNGSLIAVPERQNFACLEKEKLALTEVRCDTWRGFIFINLDNMAASLADFMAPIAARVEDFPFESMTVKGSEKIEANCNWKTAYDNFLESYHINTVHRKTVAPFIDTNSWTDERLPGGHGCLRVLKRDSQSIYQSENITSEGVSDGIAEKYRFMTVAIPRFPNATAGLDPAGFIWQSFWPTSQGTMKIHNLYLGPTLATPEADQKYWSDFIAYNNRIISEDIFLFPTIQRAMTMGDVSHIILGSQEQHIQWYHEHIDQVIGRGNVPEHLQLVPVLSRQSDDGLPI
jgi:phenylpropionate dioxygenase-like ring-hydroxylating dioxygenase large terminal subunit